MPTSDGRLRRNIELKARCADPVAARNAAIAVGAEAVGMLEQTDTYFRASHGRLKLRETIGKPAELIWYARPNHADARGSDYQIVHVSDPHALKVALSAAIGVRGVVKKRRELLMWHNVRIHLDVVENLGTFLEFEAVLTDSADETSSLERLQTLTDALGIADTDRIATSYSDQLRL
jgi:predicted adenylyl cyclase CyaB